VRRAQAPLHRQDSGSSARTPGFMSWPQRILLTTGIVFFLFAFLLIAMMLGDVGVGPEASRG
jgi:hypothetical protein